MKDSNLRWFLAPKASAVAAVPIPDNSPVGDLNTRPSRPRRAVLPAELTEDVIANPDRLELPQTDLETVMLPLHQGLKSFPYSVSKVISSECLSAVQFLIISFTLLRRLYESIKLKTFTWYASVCHHKLLTYESNLTSCRNRTYDPLRVKQTL